MDLTSIVITVDKGIMYNYDRQNIPTAVGNGLIMLGLVGTPKQMEFPLSLMGCDR